MKQRIESKHNTDSEGNPTGGETTATGLVINWQEGPLGRGKERKEPNGAFVETAIEAAVDRLEFYQRSKFACQENAAAIDWLLEALVELESRTARREARGVEGTHES